MFFFKVTVLQSLKNLNAEEVASFSPDSGVRLRIVKPETDDVMPENFIVQQLQWEGKCFFFPL